MKLIGHASLRAFTATTFGLVLLVSTAPKSRAQSADFDRAPINYQTAEVNDAVAKLKRALEAGETELAWDSQFGYLPALLAKLEVPVSSQTLVFSKTSLQLHRISPRRPRAVYFNDDIYIGYCQNGDVLELAATDSQQGAIFYTLSQEKAAPAAIVRDRGQCMTCHASSRTQDVPGYLVRSVFSDSSGYPKFGSGTFLTDHTSDFRERWGGWYVTGTHGEMRHMGNQVCDEPEQADDQDELLDLNAGANVTDLEGRFQTERYLSPHSDLVALMVMEHQSQMHNALTAANFETRRAVFQSQEMNVLLDRPADYLSESAQRRIQSAADNVVEHLLFCDEFQLTSPVAGTSSFVEEFQARGKRDARGRSLRDFDLETRLFRYPCSYLIDSDAFRGLPDSVRSRVIEQLLDVLEGRDQSEKFSHLDADTRRQILEILRETVPEFKTVKS